METNLLAKIFAPSLTKLDIGQKFYRVDKWTTNGDWIVQSAYEPAGMSIIKDKPTQLSLENIETVLNSTKNDGLLQLEILNKIELSGTVPCVALASGIVSGNSPIWLNVFYVSFMLKLKTNAPITFWGTSPKKIVIVKCGDVVIGGIAPIDRTK